MLSHFLLQYSSLYLASSCWCPHATPQFSAAITSITPAPFLKLNISHWYSVILLIWHAFLWVPVTAPCNRWQERIRLYPGVPHRMLNICRPFYSCTLWSLSLVVIISYINLQTAKGIRLVSSCRSLARMKRCILSVMWTAQQRTRESFNTRPRHGHSLAAPSTHTSDC